MVTGPEATSGRSRGGVEATAGKTLWQLIESRAAETPSGPMLLDEGGEGLTFEEYRERAERAAAGLAEMGVAYGDTVSWQLPNWIEAVVLAGALARLGALQNPLLPVYRRREVSYALEHARPKLLVVPSSWRGFDFHQMAREVSAQHRGTRLLVCSRDLPAGDAASIPSPPPEPDAVRWVFFTSGTTAEPKGVLHTDATILSAAHGMNLALELSASDLNPLVFPFPHIGGIVWLFCSLMTGCRQLLVEAFDPDETIPLMAEAGVTLAGPVTAAHLAYLAAQRQQPGRPLFPSVRAFPGGAAPKPPELHYELKEELGGVGIVSGYGLTECPILAMNHIGDPDPKLAETEGRPSPGVEVRVASDEGAYLGPGEEGELRVKGPQLCKGYLDSSLDDQSFDEAGFFRTGDLGVLDPDGYIVVKGRLKDVIIRKGETISAKEVEDVLYRHPKVADVAVIGLPDPACGERVCAVVCPADPSNPLSFAEMSRFLRREGLMTQKIPEQLEVTGPLPRGTSGKVLKRQLVDGFASR